ncbi:MAG: hypothetical protein M0Z46_10920 [Actinomycetota bacterium]|nr:hypothetical protein [Actinomycetota bacterium]
MTIYELAAASLGAVGAPVAAYLSVRSSRKRRRRRRARRNALRQTARASADTPADLANLRRAVITTGDELREDSRYDELLELISSAATASVPKTVAREYLHFLHKAFTEEELRPTWPRPDLSGARPNAPVSTSVERCPYPCAEPLARPRTGHDVHQQYSGALHRILWGDVPLLEVALLRAPPSGAWSADEIAWTHIEEPYVPPPIWGAIDAHDPHPFDVCRDANDRVAGRHIRLAVAEQRRALDDPLGLELFWQSISWLDSTRTNGRIIRNVQHDGHPIWAWFEAEDLLTPPLSGNASHKDVPLANRLAINLAVIVREPGRDLALFQERPMLDFSAGKLEAGASESVHGDKTWSAEETDIADGEPDLENVAHRCLWQELGLAAARTEGLQAVPTFPIELAFTALVLNKQELSPRLLGYAILRTTLAEVERANRLSLTSNLAHPRFGPRRKVKDARSWEHVHWLEATWSALSPIMRRPDALTPECRARLLFFLRSVDPAGEHQEIDASTPPPAWMPKRARRSASGA